MATSPTNPFDQFDEPAAQGNPFDQFDAAKPESPIIQAMQILATPVTTPIKKIGEVGTAAAETLTAGVGSLANLAISAIPAAARAAGEAAAGGSFMDRFIEDQKRYSEGLEKAVPYMPETPMGKTVTEAVGRVFEDISQGFGDINYLLNKQLGMPEAVAAAAGAIGKAAPAVLPMLPMLKGAPAKGAKVEAPKPTPVESFSTKYPNFNRRIEASQIGDAPFREARIADPSSTFAGIVEGALNKELGIPDASGLSISDRVNLVVQKYAAQSGENIPLAAQREYAAAVSNKLAELQGHIDNTVAAGTRLYRAEGGEVKGNAVMGAGWYGTPFKDIAEIYGRPEAYKIAKDLKLVAKDSKQYDAAVGKVDTAGTWKTDAERSLAITEELKASGFDGVKTSGRNVDGWVIFDSENVIKSMPALKPRVRMKTPREMEAQAQAKALQGEATKRGFTSVDDFAQKAPADFNKFAEDWRQAQVVPVERTPLSSQLLAEEAVFGQQRFRAAQAKAVKEQAKGKAFWQRGAIGDLYVKDFNDALELASKREGEVGKLTPRGWKVTVPMPYEEAVKLPPGDIINTWRAAGEAMPSAIAPQARLSTDTLMSMRHFDRTTEPVSQGRLQSVQQDIVANGIKEPVTVTISTKDNLALLTDGNHRVTAAGNAGISHVPVRYETTDMPFTAAQKQNAIPVGQLGVDISTIKDTVKAADIFEKRTKTASAEEIKFILGGPGGKQRGIFDIEGIEKNLPAAKRAIEKATGSGWVVNNPDASAKYVKDVMHQNEAALDTSRKAFGDNVAKKARRAIYAHDYDIRQDLQNAGAAGQTAHARMVVQNGATMAAKVRMDAVNEKIFDKFNHADRTALDEITRLRRIVQIDKYKGIGSVRHEGGITGPMALARLEQIKQELGGAKFQELHNAATGIFEEQKILLDRLLEHGLIDQTLHGKLYNLDYTRTEYLDIVDPAIPIASHVRNMPTSIRSSGIPELGHGKNTAVNIDSQSLLMEDMARVENRIARNNTLQAVRRLAIENPENGLVRLPGKGSVKVLANGDEAVRLTPEGWTSVGVRVEGKQKFIQMRDEYAEQFVARPEAMPEWLATTFRTISGTQLLKSTATGYNPSFVIAGIPMDILHTWVSTSGVYSPHLPVYLAQMGKDMTRTAKDAWMKTGAWEDAMREGIGSSYLTHESRSLTDPSKSVKSLMAPRLAKIRSTLSYVNDSADMWIRLAYRNRLMQDTVLPDGTVIAGMESWKATAMARDRLDYFQGGMVAKAFDTIIPYLNVSIQATGKAAETAMRDPHAFAIKAAWITSTAAAFKLAGMITSPETDKNIPVMDKVRNFNITFGDSYYILDANGNRRYMYVPLRLDQVAMPFNAAVVGGLEKAEYGQAPVGLTGSAIGQIAPINSAYPIPTMDAIATYVSNYDAFTKGPVYRGPVVRPEDEIRTFGEGTPTSGAAQMIGQATGMSPMRLEAASGKMVNMNNFYIQAMGGFNKLMFEGADPREQAASTLTMLQHVPGLRSIVKLTSPGVGLIEELQKAEEAAGSQTSSQMHGLNDLVFQFEHKQNNVTMKTIETYINNQPPQERQKLADHAKFTLSVNKIMEHYEASAGIPPRSWWIASAKASPEARAQAFYNQWVSASAEDRTRMLGIANSLQNSGVGYLSPDFQRAFAAERKLLGDARR